MMSSVIYSVIDAMSQCLLTDLCSSQQYTYVNYIFTSFVSSQHSHYFMFIYFQLLYKLQWNKLVKIVYIV